MAALAVPAFTEFFEKSRLRGATDGLVSFFNAQRLAAVKFDRQVNVSIRGATNAWCVGARVADDPTVGQQVPAATTCDCSDDATECVVDGQQTVLASTAFGGSGTRPSIDAADIAVVYDGRRGTLTPLAAGGNVVLTSNSGRWRLRIDVLALGQARACVPSGSPPLNGFNAC
jgi:Tfp pilus assembly protein FimT